MGAGTRLLSEVDHFNAVDSDQNPYFFYVFGGNFSGSPPVRQFLGDELKPGESRCRLCIYNSPYSKPKTWSTVVGPPQQLRVFLAGFRILNRPKRVRAPHKTQTQHPKHLRGGHRDGNLQAQLFGAFLHGVQRLPGCPVGAGSASPRPKGHFQRF